MRTFVRSKNRWFAAVSFLAMLLAAVGTLLSALDERSLPVGVLSAAASVGLVLLVARASRAGVILDNEYLIYRGYLRSHRLARREVSIIHSSQIDSKIFYEVHAPVLTAVDGQEYSLASLAGACLDGKTSRGVEARTDVLRRWVDEVPRNNPSETR